MNDNKDNTLIVDVEAMNVESDKFELKWEYGSRWLFFYVFIRCPLSIIRSVVDMLISNEAWDRTLSFIDIIWLSALFYGLRNFKSWAWKVNMVVIVLEAFIRPLPPDFEYFDFWSYIAKAIGIGIIWVYPNIVYFKKRRHWFTK